MNRKPRTAAELLEELESDPDDVSRRREREQQRRRREEELHTAQAPLLEELRARAGLDVDSVWDLVNTSEPYSKALPILLRHLDQPYPDRVREGIARALAVPGQAGLAWEEVRRSYLKEPVGTNAKDGLAVALAALVDDERMEQLVELLTDVQHGESRVFFVRPVSESNLDRSQGVLDDLVADPHLEEEIRRKRS